MSSLFRSVTITYRDKQGKKCQKGTPGARKVRLRSKVWYGRYKDASGARKTVPLCADKGQAKDLLAKLVADAKQKEIYPEPELTEQERRIKDQGQRPLTEHLDDFRRYLGARGNTEEHVNKTHARARAVVEGCRFVRIADLQPSAVVEFLAGLRAEGERIELPEGQELFTTKEVALLLGIQARTVGALARRRFITCQGQGRKRRFAREDVAALVEVHSQGVGIATTNHYLAAVKSFAKWLVKDGRAAVDPLAHLSRQNARVDVRRQRRPLSGEELTRLIDSAMKGKPFRGLVGEDRAFLYLLAAGTGFRAKELGSLTPGSFDLDGDPPTVTVEAGYSKHRRQDAQTLRKDVSRLAESGVHPKMAQILARHSTISLTMDYYTHLGIHDQTAALDKLPPIAAPKKPEQAHVEDAGKHGSEQTGAA